MQNGARHTESAVDRAYRLVRTAILTGTYGPDSRLTEQEIAATAGVSRTPVREALRRLHADGLVVFVPQQGAVVASWSERDIDDLFELRALLESYAAARAAQRIGPAGLAQLRALAVEIHDQCRSSADDAALTRYIDLNARFHQTLLAAADSDRLCSMFGALAEGPLTAQAVRSYQPDDLLRATAHHVEIVDALEARDPDWAASVVRSHIHSAANMFRARRRAQLTAGQPTGGSA